MLQATLFQWQKLKIPARKPVSGIFLARNRDFQQIRLATLGTCEIHLTLISFFSRFSLRENLFIQWDEPVKMQLQGQDFRSLVKPRTANSESRNLLKTFFSGMSYWTRNFFPPLFSRSFHEKEWWSLTTVYKLFLKSELLALVP